MGDRKLSISNILEPLFLGLSCIIGGEQFFILLSHRECSIRKQSVVFFLISLITIIVFGLIKMDDIIFNGVHILYIILLIFKLMFVRSKTRSTFVVSLLVISISFFMSLLILLSCCFYCTSRVRLLYFIFGLFASRFLPSFIWYFYDKKTDYQKQLQSVSSMLATLRILFCLISIVLRVFSGRFNVSDINKLPSSYTNFPSYWPTNMSTLGYHLYKYWLSVFTEIISNPNSTNCTDSDFLCKYFPYISPLSTFLPFLSLFVSVAMFLKSPPITVAFYYPYSAKLLSTIDMLKTISHLCGSLLGITYPLSVTGNSHLFYFVLIFFYPLYIAFTIILKKYALLFGIQYYYLIYAITGFALGYMWSYCLGIVINTTLTQTCIHEEHRNCIIPCCGDRVIDQCYCKFSARPNPDKLHRPGQVSMRFSCSKLVCENGGSSSSNSNGPCKEIVNKKKGLFYSPSGCNAIVLCYNCNGKCTKQVCSGECCTKNKKDCCLKLFGCYQLDTITTSSCEDCQLTVRLEADCNGDNSCSICGTGSQCKCSDSSDKCCICVKCCAEQCNGGAQQCCIKFCNCTGGPSCSCNCNEARTKGGTRLFIYCSNGDSNCCIKEIRPNFPSNFDGCLNGLGNFDIRDITISDCCHTPLRVDLHCTKKNNFFRLSEVNYKNKLEKPNKITLKSSCNVCCNKPGSSTCCCPYKQLVKLSLAYPGDSSQSSQTETSGCGSSGSDSGTCPKLKDLTVGKYCSFDKRVSEIRVKVVVTWWLLFGLVYTFTFLIIMMIRSNNKLYEFKPNVKYDDLIKKYEKQNVNSVEHLDKRITVAISVETEMVQLIENKKKETDDMVKLFNKYLGQSDAVKLSSYITTQSRSYVSSTKNQEIKRLDFKIVLWGYCLGMLYKYVMCLFFDLQKFFVLWENLWITEFLKYNNVLKPDLSKISEKSRFKLDLMSVDNTEDKLNTLGVSRLASWKDILSEMKGFSDLSTEEHKLHKSTLPADICRRLRYYVDRWEHRMYSIISWINLNNTMFDWHYFVAQYHSIQSWLEQLTPYLGQAPDIQLIHKELNKGTEVFNYTPK